MRLLILGGTRFVGRHLTERVLAQGHTVTLFTRGQTNPELFPQAERLQGDRNSDLSALEGRTWDAVVDTCGYFPRQVRMAAERLAASVGHYTFISSISVYQDFKVKGIDETYPTGTLTDSEVEEITGETYGPLKALCEQTLTTLLPGRVLNIRPGLIVGPHDPTDRFTYWPVRVSDGGEVLAPKPSDLSPQFIDVRDLAEWTLQMIEAGNTGDFNADCPPETITMQGLLDMCREISGSDAKFAWVESEFLTEAKVAPWSELPLWIGEDPDSEGFYAVRSDRAMEAGLKIRPTSETVRDTLEWAKQRPADHSWRAGLSREREIELLQLWKEQSR